MRLCYGTRECEGIGLDRMDIGASSKMTHLAASEQIRPVLLFGALLLAAIGLQCYRLSFVTLWSDEFSGTLQVITLPWQALFTGNYPWEFNPPLYFLGLKAWIALFGASEIVMRSFSILLHSVCLCLIYALGQKLGTWRVGLAAMAVLAFHPVYTTYATELRMYPLLILFSLAALLSFFEYTLSPAHRPIWLIILVISLALAVYTHYFGVITILGIFTLSASYLLLSKDKHQKSVLLILPIVACLVAPALLLAFQQLLRYAQKSTTQQYPRLGLSAIAALFSGSMTFEISITNSIQIASLLSVIAGVIVLVRNKRTTLAMGLVGFICLASLLAITLSARNINVVPRYLIHISLISWLLACLALMPSQDVCSRYLRVLTLVAVLMNSVAGIDATAQRTYHAPNWKQVASIIQQQALPAEPVVIMGWDAAPTEYYLDRPWLTSYDFEQQLQEQHAGSYVIVDSKYARKLAFVDLTTNVIYEDAQWNVRIVRYTPAIAP